MSKVLYIQASPRRGRSHSIAVADAFVDAYRNAHPDDEVDVWNVFDADLPPFDGLAVQAKYTILHGKDHTPEEQAAWKAVEDVVARFTAADKLVLAVPMWNFGIPYRLKQLIDLVVQPGYTFSFSPEKGYEGLLTGKRAFVVYARGGDYPEGTEAEAMDFQRRYLETLLGFIGITDVRSITLQPMLMAGPDIAAHERADGIAKAREMAAAF